MCKADHEPACDEAGATEGAAHGPHASHEEGDGNMLANVSKDEGHKDESEIVVEEGDVKHEEGEYFVDVSKDSKTVSYFLLLALVNH